MAETLEQEPRLEDDKSFSRRNFIKGVIAGGAATYSAGYLFRAGVVQAQSSAPGAVERLITLRVKSALRWVAMRWSEELHVL